MSSMDESESHSYLQSYVLIITDRISALYPICTIFTSAISVYYSILESFVSNVLKAFSYLSIIGFTSELYTPIIRFCSSIG